MYRSPPSFLLIFLSIELFFDWWVFFFQVFFHAGIWVICFINSCCYCSVAKTCLILCNPMDCSMSGFPVLHSLPEFAQTHVHSGEGNGNRLQYSCLENPMDREAWLTIVHRVAESRTWLKRFSMHACSVMPSNHPILCLPILLLPSVFPSIRILCIFK